MTSTQFPHLALALAWSKSVRGKAARRLLAATVSVVCFVPLSASAREEVTGLNIFGDSLVDAGNLFNLTDLPPSPPYAQRLSNGPVWVEQLADELDLESALSTIALPELFGGTAPPPTEGINFAFGGALSSDVNVGGPPLPGLQQQVETFSALSVALPPDPDALYILLAGGNDYNQALFNFDPSRPLDQLANQVTDNLADATASLIGLGAKHVLVSNLPDLGLQPFAQTLNQFNPQSAQLLTGLSQQHNQLLDQKLTALEANSDADIIQLDLASLFESVIASPDTFGLNNVTDTCLTNFQPGFVFDGVCENPDEFLFWDNVHPTEAGHRLIADLAIATLAEKAPDNPVPSVPEPMSVLGLIVGGGAIALSTRRTSKLSS